MMRENAARALGAYSRCTDKCDFRAEVVRAGALEELKKCLLLPSSSSILRLHSIMAMSVLVAQPGAPEEAEIFLMQDKELLQYLQNIMSINGGGHEGAAAQSILSSLNLEIALVPS